MNSDIIERLCAYVEGIVHDSPVPDPPITRAEAFLSAIKTGANCDAVALTRLEKYLARINGRDIVIPLPIERAEKYLAVLCGIDVELPEYPMSRLEELLAEWVRKS